jgi:hypothetical protein
MIQNIISIALISSSVIFLLGTWILLPARPKSYVSLDAGVTTAKYNEAGLKGLHFITVLTAFSQTAISVYFLSRVAEFGLSVCLPFILACAGWVTVHLIKGICRTCLWKDQSDSKFCSRRAFFAIPHINLARIYKSAQHFSSFCFHETNLEC